MDAWWPRVSFWRHDASLHREKADVKVLLHEVRHPLPIVGTDNTGLDEKMRLVNHRVEAWHVFWSDYYGEFDGQRQY
jgi:hypothetical protein